jgi:hypothetical protein
LIMASNSSFRRILHKSVGRFRPTGSNLLLRPIYCDWKPCSIQLIVRYVM